MSDEPEITPLDANVPEILTFGMSGGFLGATINMATDPTGPNIASRTQARLVMAPTQADLETRCTSTLISEFGLTQGDAQALIPSAMQPLVPTGQYLPLSGGTLVGTLEIDNTGLPQTAGFSQNIILGNEQDTPNSSILFRGQSGTDLAFILGRNSGTVFLSSETNLDGSGYVVLMQMSRNTATFPSPVTCSAGLKFGFGTAGGITDLSNTGIAIYSSNYGINYTANQINYTAPSSGRHCFNSGAGIKMTIASTGTTFNAQVGFNSSAPVTKQTVTGSRSDGSALLSALTGLVAYGLITDNSTA